MKNFLLFFAIFNISLFAQEINNAGFENWTEVSTGVYDPDGWFNLDFGWDGVQREADAHSGTYAAKMRIVNYMTDIMSSLLYTYTPATQSYGSINGWYKFVPQRPSDVFSIDVLMYSGSSIFGAVGATDTWETNSAVSVYTQFSIPIEYFSSEAPDSAWIIFTLEDTAETPATGAYVLLDDLSWGAVVGVKEVNSNIPTKFAMQQNYPNPFNPSTRIEYTIPEASFVQLKVYDIVGNELTTLVNEYQPAGTFRAEFNAANLSSGIYIAKLTAGSFTKTMKMTLLK